MYLSELSYDGSSSDFGFVWALPCSRRRYSYHILPSLVGWSPLPFWNNRISSLKLRIKEGSLLYTSPSMTFLHSRAAFPSLRLPRCLRWLSKVLCYVHFLGFVFSLILVFRCIVSPTPSHSANIILTILRRSFSERFSTSTIRPRQFARGALRLTASTVVRVTVQVHERMAIFPPTRYTLCYQAATTWAFCTLFLVVLS